MNAWTEGWTDFSGRGSCSNGNILRTFERKRDEVTTRCIQQVKEQLDSGITVYGRLEDWDRISDLA